MKKDPKHQNLYEDLGFAKVDHSRVKRRGFPEVIYCRGKRIEQIKEIAQRIAQSSSTVLLTKANRNVFHQLKKRFSNIRYNEIAKMAYLTNKTLPLYKNKKGFVLVLTAGTSDIPVAEEAAVTLEVMGDRVRRLYDVGVAGIHRLLNNRNLLNRARVVIVVAGMEGALASVVSGLICRPVIAVPTSVGYGASFKGVAPLLTMLNSCSPGVVVVNIDNGFGAGYFANLING